MYQVSATCKILNAVLLGFLTCSQQCRQTFRTAAPDKRGSVCLPGHHGELPEAYVYANITFAMLRLHWHSFILCLLLNNTLALLQFPFSVLLWHTFCHITAHEMSTDTKSHQRSTPSSCFGMSRTEGVVDSPRSPVSMFL